MNTYITLFSCAGVGCYGFKLNGFECVASNELLEARLNVQRANNKCKYDTGYICGDITAPTTQQKIFDEIDFWKANEGLKQVDVVFATPPCQGMSTANYKKAEDEQVRNSLVVQAIKLISEIKPKIFIFENVRAFLKTLCTDLDGTDKPIADSIESNLAAEYNIYSKVINFKDYGVPSSRPRTIVIGTSKKETSLSPLSLFPSRHKEITLRDAIGNMPSLNYCEKDKNDYLHFARPFPIEQLPWIENLKEGQSAFSQPIELQPGYLNGNGEKVVNKGAYMGNKYRRLTWDKVCSCIHTRNDILSSQDTIHPTDNRVLSIRELMRLMTIPNTFCWTPYDKDTTVENSDKYLKDNELNIRRCIGEAVPTAIIKSVSAKIAYALNMPLDSEPSQMDIYTQIIKSSSSKDIIRIKVADAESFVNVIPQLAGLFSEKSKIEAYCVTFSEDDSSRAKQVLKDWGLTDFVRTKMVKPSDAHLGKCEFCIKSNVMSTLGTYYQPSLFD